MGQITVSRAILKTPIPGTDTSRYLPVPHDTDTRLPVSFEPYPSLVPWGTSMPILMTVFLLLNYELVCDGRTGEMCNTAYRTAG